MSSLSLQNEYVILLYLNFPTLTCSKGFLQSQEIIIPLYHCQQQTLKILTCKRYPIIFSPKCSQYNSKCSSKVLLLKHPLQNACSLKCFPLQISPKISTFFITILWTRTNRLCSQRCSILYSFQE